MGSLTVTIVFLSDSSPLTFGTSGILEAVSAWWGEGRGAIPRPTPCSRRSRTPCNRAYPIASRCGHRMPSSVRVPRRRHWPPGAHRAIAASSVRKTVSTHPYPTRQFSCSAMNHLAADPQPLRCRIFRISRGCSASELATPRSVSPVCTSPSAVARKSWAPLSSAFSFLCLVRRDSP